MPDKKNIIMTREQVRAFDDWAINTVGIPAVVLMENAGRSCAELIEKKIPNVAGVKVCIFCGTGNNGGDGYVIARHLLNKGYNVVVVVAGDRNKIKGEAKTNLDVLGAMGQAIGQVNPADADIADQIRTLTLDAGLIVDSLFGTGLEGRLRGGFQELIEAINAQNCPVLAVDIPSGLDCDTGRPLGAAVKADYTVTFVAVKKGYSNPEAARYTGDIFIASIGIDAR